MVASDVYCRTFAAPCRDSLLCSLLANNSWLLQPYPHLWSWLEEWPVKSPGVDVSMDQVVSFGYLLSFHMIAERVLA